MTTPSNPPVPDNRLEDGEQLENNKNGQLLSIFLPEGSVLVDRTELKSETSAIGGQAPATISVDERSEQLESFVKANTGSELQHWIDLAVSKVMSENSEAQEQQVNKAKVLPNYLIKNHKRKNTKVNIINSIAMIAVTFTILVPLAISSLFAITFYPMKASIPALSISQGDLLLSKIVPVSSLKSGDLFLTRNPISSTIVVSEVTSVNTNQQLTTIVNSNTSDLKILKSQSLSSDIKVNRIDRSLPGVGFILLFLFSNLFKITSCLAILILNLAMFFRRFGHKKLETIFE